MPTDLYWRGIHQNLIIPFSPIAFGTYTCVCISLKKNEWQSTVTDPPPVYRITSRRNETNF